jgi:glycosyltransferase involved in cell wall biosynthesis
MKPLKIIYVCPYAHYSGHHPHASTIEPKVLFDAGVDVILVTFCGITNNPTMPVKHYKVMNDWRILKWIRKSTIPRWFLMLCETVATLWKAIRLYRKYSYDVIYLRDGEPFFPISHMLSLPFRNIRWVVSLTGANLFTPNPSRYKLLRNPFIYIYVAMQKLMQSDIWRSGYKLSLARNKFAFVTQNDEVRLGYNKYQGGIFNGKVKCVPLGVPANSVIRVSKTLARTKLDLPQNGRLVLLSFGAPHPGKDIETLVKAQHGVKNTFVIHVGTQAFSLGSNPKKLTEEYGVGERTAIFDYYVPEGMKPLFFGGADAIVLSYTKVFKPTPSMLWETVKYGLPVISSDANLLGKLVRKYNLGILFKAENSDSLIDAIHQFSKLGNKELGEIKAGGQKFISDYSHDKWAEHTIKVCRGLLQ